MEIKYHNVYETTYNVYGTTYYSGTSSDPWSERLSCETCLESVHGSSEIYDWTHWARIKHTFCEQHPVKDYPLEQGELFSDQLLKV